MKRLALLAALIVATGCVAVADASTAPSCRHRAHHRCPRKRAPQPAPLPRRLEVDENDQGVPPQPYSLRPSHNPVGTGTVQFNVYNFGEDAHTFAVLDARGHQLAFANVPAGQLQTELTLGVTLSAGRYTLECTLPGHAQLGMRAQLTVG